MADAGICQIGKGLILVSTKDTKSTKKASSPYTAIAKYGVRNRTIPNSENPVPEQHG